jgi:hypothetical protein
VPKLNPTLAPWTPVTPEEQELVLAELEAILSSYHFRGSKRYPGLLRYVVKAALEGRAGDLKERTLGVEVFGRDPQYDTNTDPVVRISAGEVRKRIAQYYHENQETARVRIELPMGSYAPEFLLSEPETASVEPHPQERASVAPAAGAARRFSWRLVWLGVMFLLLAAGGFAAYFYRQAAAAKMTPAEKLLAPLFKSQRPILIVIGTSHPNKVPRETAQTSFGEHTTGPYHHVSLATAIALANVSGILRQNGRAYEVKEDTEATLTDIRSRSLILIGASNNMWTMRLVDPLRYRFLKDTVIQIQDTKNPQRSDWSIDFSMPFSQVTRDYAMVARFHNATTEGPVLVVAGVGPYGTEAASEFVASAAYLEQMQQKMPAGWENKDFQVILKSDVIDSKAGPPVMVTETVW